MRDTSGVVLGLIRSAGQISRVDLSGRSGLTEASISRIVRELLDDGVIVETGLGLSTGGKRPTLLRMNNAARHAVGVFLGESAIRYVLADLGGTVIAGAETEGVAATHQLRDVLRRIPTEINQLVNDAEIDTDSLVGIGVAIPGRRESGSVSTYDGQFDYVDWDWGAIEVHLAHATGLPVAVENDSTCAAIGEYWVSGAAATDDILVVNLTIGFGCGLVTGGDVYRGASSRVGEIGHVTLDWNGPECSCGRRGCLEVFAAPARLVVQALAIDGVRERLELSGNPAQYWDDFERLSTAAVKGDRDARSIVETSARALATTLISLTNVLDLQQVVLTGPGFDIAGDIYARIATEQLPAYALTRTGHPFTVRLSVSRRDSAALGAATLVIHQRLGSSRRLRIARE